MSHINQSILDMLKNGATVKLIGDSITAGCGSSDNNPSGETFMTMGTKKFNRQLGNKCWASLFSCYIRNKFPKSFTINNGCSNINSTHVRENLTKFYNSKDDIIIIMIGTNDRKQVNGMGLLFDNLTYIVQYLKNQNKKIILMSPNPSTVENESYPNRFYHMKDVNNEIRRVANDEDIQFISHYNYINNYLFCTGKTIESLMIGTNYKLDGLHPPDKVHYLIYKNLIENLNLST